MSRFAGRCLVLCGLLSAAGLGAQEPVDLVIHNGVIFTADAVLSVHGSMAVRDGRVVALGGQELLGEHSAAEVLDLQGRFVVPGFNDSHPHIRGRPRRYVHVEGVQSIAELRERVAAKAEEMGPGEWIIGWGWSEDELAARRLPTKEDLDAVFPDNPAAIARAGGHSAVLNSLALELARIGRDSPDPQGGVIDRTASGDLTGIIRENWSGAARLIPESTYAELRGSMVESLRAQFSYGITSFIEARTSPMAYEMWQDAYAEHRGELPRAAVQIHLPVGSGEGEEAAERLQTNNPMRTPVDHGIFVALGADIIPIGSLLGIYAAVTRRGMSGAIYGRGEALSMPEALVGYTRNGAYLTFEEDTKGTLEPGKYADFVVLSDDLRRIDPNTIRDEEVVMAFLGGRRVYEARARVVDRASAGSR